MISFEKSIGAVVFRRENNKIYYLLLNYGHDYWGYPKGHQEKGESDEETLRREVKEETGINDLNIIPGFQEKIKYFYRAEGKEKEERKKAGKKTLIFKSAIFYLGETKIKEIKISYEHVGYEWLSYNEAILKVSFKNSQKVLEKTNNYLII